MNHDSSLSGHISRRFDSELEDLRNQVLNMGGLVETQVSNGLKALLNVDSALAKIVAEGDYAVNAKEVAIDQQCVRLLAQRQPAASDLRLIVTIIKIIADLERIGDQAEKLGRFGLQLSDQDATTAQFVKLEHLGALVSKMLHKALDAFARVNDSDALETISLDHKIDEEYEALLRQLITHMMEDARNIKSLLCVSWCARALERIGDHATNICEHIVYLVQGKNMRHTKFGDSKNQ